MQIPIEELFENGKEARTAEEAEKLEEYARIKLGECYEGIQEVIDYYMDLPVNDRKLLAIHLIATYFHKNFDSFPYGYFNGTKSSGKSRILRLASYFSYLGNGTIQSSIKEATIFRMTEGQSLIIDECENLGRKGNETIIELLNNCYKKGAVITRQQKKKDKEKESYESIVFRSYRPIWLANIWGLDNVLGDRVITYLLEKSNNPSKIKKIENFNSNLKIQEIKRTLEKLVSFVSCRYAAQHVVSYWNDYINETYNDTNDIITETTLTTLTTLLFKNEELNELFVKIDNSNIDGRNLELFMPLLLVARELNEETFLETLEIAKTKVGEKKEDDVYENKDASLYEFIASMPSILEFIFMKELTNRFRTFIGSEEEWITEKWMGKALKRLNLILDKKREASGRLVILDYSKAREKLKIFKASGGKDETKQSAV
jgi:hypothetical protein